MLSTHELTFSQHPCEGGLLIPCLQEQAQRSQSTRPPPQSECCASTLSVRVPAPRFPASRFPDPGPPVTVMLQAVAPFPCPMSDDLLLCVRDSLGSGNLAVTRQGSSHRGADGLKCNVQKNSANVTSDLLPQRLRRMGRVPGSCVFIRTRGDSGAGGPAPV